MDYRIRSNVAYGIESFAVGGKHIGNIVIEVNPVKNIAVIDGDSELNLPAVLNGSLPYKVNLCVIVFCYRNCIRFDFGSDDDRDIACNIFDSICTVRTRRNFFIIYRYLCYGVSFFCFDGKFKRFAVSYAFVDRNSSIFGIDGYVIYYLRCRYGYNNVARDIGYGVAVSFVGRRYIFTTDGCRYLNIFITGICIDRKCKIFTVSNFLTVGNAVYGCICRVDIYRIFYKFSGDYYNDVAGDIGNRVCIPVHNNFYIFACHFSIHKHNLVTICCRNRERNLSAVVNFLPVCNAVYRGICSIYFNVISFLSRINGYYDIARHIGNGVFISFICDACIFTADCCRYGRDFITVFSRYSECEVFTVKNAFSNINRRILCVCCYGIAYLRCNYRDNNVARDVSYGILIAAACGSNAFSADSRRYGRDFIACFCRYGECERSAFFYTFGTLNGCARDVGILNGVRCYGKSFGVYGNNYVARDRLTGNGVCIAALIKLYILSADRCSYRSQLVICLCLGRKRKAFAFGCLVRPRYRAFGLVVIIGYAVCSRCAAAATAGAARKHYKRTHCKYKAKSYH